MGSSLKLEKRNSYILKTMMTWRGMCMWCHLKSQVEESN